MFPSLSINYVAVNKDLEKLPPQLHLIKMTICYDQGYYDIGVRSCSSRSELS